MTDNYEDAALTLSFMYTLFKLGLVKNYNASYVDYSIFISVSDELP